jgi:pimeloyl-ACP methyl ester carboxylesterase
MIEAVEIATSDGSILRGELRRGEADWVILVADLGEDLDAWHALPDRLARQGMTVLTFDLRGHGGSDGDADPSRTATDVADVIGFAQATGADRIYVGAAGATTGPVLRACEGSRCEGLFALAPRGEGLDRSSIPKLAVIGSRDPTQEAAGAELGRSGGWPVVIRLPVRDRGCEILRGDWGANVQDSVSAFLRDRRRSSSSRAATGKGLR